MKKACSPLAVKSYISYGYKVKNQRYACGFHSGIDIVSTGNNSNVKIYSPFSGTVESVNGHGQAYGNHITITYKTGSTHKNVTFAHLKSKPNYKKGDKISVGSYIGIMGGSGYGKSNYYATHLHIEIHKGATYSYGVNLIDPTTEIDLTKLNKPIKNYKVKTNGKNLNLRNDTLKTIIGTLANGTIVNVLDSKVKGYYHISAKCTDGKTRTGYASKEYIRLS